VNSVTSDKLARVVDVLKYLHCTEICGCLGGSSIDCPGHFVRYTLIAMLAFAARPETRRLVTGYVMNFEFGSISWKTARQPAVSRFTAESEHIAAREFGKEA
jgi:hypothetical protein